MKSYKSIASVFAAAILCSFLLLSCGKEKVEEIDDGKMLDQDTIAIKVTKVEVKDIEIFKTYSGTLEGEKQANIVAKISERILSIRVRVGDYIPKGSIVVELDKVGAASQYYQAEAGYLNAEKELERMKALYNEGAIAQQMLDGTQTAFNIAKANYEASKSLVELTAPISGVVTEINGEAGDLTVPGMQIIKLADINRLKAIINVGEQDIMSIYINQPIQVFSELQPDLTMQGTINQISNSADVQSRTFEIKGSFLNTRDKWFKPGMFCRVKILFTNKKGSLAIPSVSVITNGNEKGVYVINNGRAYFRKVKFGITNDNVTEILNGLKEQETIVTLGMNNLKEGIPVHVSQ